MHRKVVLSNGVRLVAERMPSTRSVTLGVWVNVGSRDERDGEEGVSHFIEHMFFKGTRRRSAARISREIDALGGEMNAFTTREATALYVKVVDQHLPAALALLADLFHNSKFEPKELEKEKQVVLEEIRMVQDDPEDLLQDLHLEHQLQRHPLGRSILGAPHTIRRFRQEHLLRYIDDHYEPSQTVVAVAGNFEWKPLVKLLERHFGSSGPRNGRRTLSRRPAEIGAGVLVRSKELEQAHLCLLNTILGGGVSSRLFQEVRERRGLAYSIYSYLSSFSDTGTLTIYAATRPREVARVVELACRILRRLRRQRITRAELLRAKAQMKGGLMLSLEGTHSRMNKLAKDELHHAQYFSLQKMLDEIDRVSPRQIDHCAQDILDLDRLCVTALGPVRRSAVESAVQ